VDIIQSGLETGDRDNFGTLSYRRDWRCCLDETDMTRMRWSPRSTQRADANACTRPLRRQGIFSASPVDQWITSLDPREAACVTARIRLTDQWPVSSTTLTQAAIMVSEDEFPLRSGWEWRVFWAVSGPAPSAPALSWATVTRDKLQRALQDDALGSDARAPEHRTDTYAELGDPCAGLKLRGAAEEPALLELKLRRETDAADGGVVLERWDKVLAVNLPVARERVDLVDVARELGAGEFYSAVRTFSDRTMQFAVDKVRVQASGQDDMKLKVEAAEMIVDGKWFRSVCVEGRSKLGVRRLAENHVVRSVWKEECAGDGCRNPKFMGYPEFLHALATGSI
jgi:hypothetical protein